MRLANITAQQLLSWSVTIDLAEQYQFYLNAPNCLLNEYFYNCTEPWFGRRCQYSFAFDAQMSIDEIVNAVFHGRAPYDESSDMIIPLPCYVLLKCDRGGSLLCLDWREVCDGQVDCLNEDFDEKFCFGMELNECEENEYRCHNGLCIPKELWEGGLGDADCLDRSDELSDLLYIQSCFQDPTFRCEEHSCKASWDTFSCGDGQCVLMFKECRNGRHVLLINSMTTKGNLSDKCWLAMVCFTGLVNQVNGSVCETWLTNNHVSEFDIKCDSLIQFPTVPVHFGHIRFLYNTSWLRSKVGTYYLPNYICYDTQLCDYPTPTFFYENLTCLYEHELDLGGVITEHLWADRVLQIKRYFRSCLTTHAIFDNETEYFDHPSLYKCQNSTKLISKHRIIDQQNDCYFEDDENYQNSCLLNDPYRIKCPNANKCLSPLLKIDACLSNSEPFKEKIAFQSFCNGIEEHTFAYFDGLDYTDESECDHWPCDNIYARCDGIWACSDGRDEYNCSRTNCPLGTHPCISPANYTLTCLPHQNVKDGIDDCLGASDEQGDCQIAYSWGKVSERFRCLNDYLCLPSFELCNNATACPLHDDEKFCEHHRFMCDKDLAHNRNVVEDVLCALIENNNERTQYFSVRTSSNYPPLEKSLVAEITQWPTKQHPVAVVVESEVQNNLWPWYCNRGLIVRVRDGNDSDDHTCMCPPSYYGHLCQYQNQRVSFTLRVSSTDRRNTYAIVIMLIDDNDERQEVDSHDQFVYIAQQSCSIKLNRYLLFSTRPKNVSKNYSVRVDTFKKNTMTYIGSWHFPITFLFLPVNRLVAVLDLSNQPVPISSSCLITCKNGQCMRYLNREKYFCRCFPEWSGVHCDIPINCHICSSDSICMASTNNQPICVCPLNKFGPRCLFTSSCPLNACQNDGQCIPADVSIPGSQYTCVCSDRFSGPKCEHLKAKLDVSLNGIKISSHLLAYFFTLSNESEPIKTIMLQKLTLFQHSVTFRISSPFHLVIINVSDICYLAALQQTPKMEISTSINSARECVRIDKLFNSTITKMVHYRRVKLYHIPCQTLPDLICFIDEYYLCLCTNDRHANCMDFDRDRNFQCSSTNHCENGATCLEDHPTCPSTRICVCTDCFFGNQCQFYAKGLGSTLDEILGYEIKSQTSLSKQPFSVKISAVITMKMFIIGIINGIISIMTFTRKNSQEVGCGIYLLASSMTSTLAVILFTIKFWFLYFSHRDFNGQRFILHANCLFVEPFLKMVLYADNWLNACVAMERGASVFQGVSFNKNKSKQVAKWVIISLLIIIISLFIPQLLHLHLFDDEKEERTWCVVTYSPWLQRYSSTMIFFHYFAPFLINIFSALFIIISTTCVRAGTQTDRNFCQHFMIKLKQYKHLLISPTVITILTLPYLIISVMLDCKKSSDLFWFYLIGYFLSFIPAIFIFFIFVVPSPLYKKEFDEVRARIRRRLNVLTMSFNSR